MSNYDECRREVEEKCRERLDVAALRFNDLYARYNALIEMIADGRAFQRPAPLIMDKFQMELNEGIQGERNKLREENAALQAEVARLKADLGVLRSDLALRTQEISRLKQALQDSTTVRNEFA